MSDETVVDQQEEAQNTPDASLNALIDKLNKSMDERFSGFQSLLDKKVSPIEATLEELKLSRMSPAEREEFIEDQVKEENARLKRQLAIFEKSKDHPEEVAFLTDFLKQDNLDAQLALLRNFKGNTPAPTPSEGDEGNEPEPEVNLNNPPRKQTPSLGNLLSSGRMTKEAAQQLLSQNNERGALRKLRG